MRLQRVERLLHVAVGCVEDGIAARLLIAAGDERVQRQRIGVRHRVLLLDQNAQHARLEQRQQRTRVSAFGEYLAYDPSHRLAYPTLFSTKRLKTRQTHARRSNTSKLSVHSARSVSWEGRIGSSPKREAECD